LKHYINVIITHFKTSFACTATD